MEGVALVVSGPPVLALSGALDLPAGGRAQDVAREHNPHEPRLEPIDLDRADDLWLPHQDPGIAGYDGIWSREKAERTRGGIRRVVAQPGVAFTEVHNRRSRAVMERLGMHYRSEIRWRGLVEGKPGVHDDAPFGLYAVSRR